MGKALIYELGRSISFGRLPLLAKVLWPMLLAASDDQGRGLAEPDVIKWTVCPNVQEITTENIPQLLQAMVEQGMIEDYQDSRGRRLYQVVRWWEYQRLQWAKPSQYEAPPGWRDRIRYRDTTGYHEENWGASGNGAGEEAGEGVGDEVDDEASEAIGTGVGNEVGEAIGTGVGMPIAAPTNQNKPNQNKPNQTKPREGKKKEENSTGIPPPLSPFQLALAELCQIEPATMTTRQSNDLLHTANRLDTAGKQASDVKRFQSWWYAHDWRGKKDEPPLLHQVLETWGTFELCRNDNGNRKRRRDVDGVHAAYIQT